jgi:predicted metalloprotease with PDZ domain
MTRVSNASGTRKLTAAISSAVISAGLLFCSSFIATAKASEAPSEVIHYTLRPLVGVKGVDALEVEVHFVGNREGQSTFKLPSDAMGGHERWTYLSQFRGHDVRIIASDKDKRTFQYRPGAPVTIRYRVRSAYVEKPTVEDAFAGPAIFPHWLATLGEFIFTVPEHAETTPVTFEWKPGPEHWICLSNLDHPGTREPLTVTRLLASSIIASPHLKVVERPIFGGVLRMAAVGSWSVPIDRDADLVAKIVSAQRAFWGDMTGPVTVTTLALAGSGQGSAGVGGYRGFAHYVSASTAPAQQLREIAHELIHNWIPGRLGEMPDENDEASLYWFSEGFTEFYTQRTLLRSGTWSLEDFIGDLNDTLAGYAANPNNRQPNDWTSARFWIDDAARRVPYMRGDFLAYLLDNQIRQASDNKIGLDQVIFRMRDRWMSAPTDHRPGVLENLQASYQELLGSDAQLDAAIKTYITQGEFVRLPVDMFGQCATIDPSETPHGQGSQTIRLRPMDEQQRVMCAQSLP